MTDVGTDRSKPTVSASAYHRGCLGIPWWPWRRRRPTQSQHASKQPSPKPDQLDDVKLYRLPYQRSWELEDFSRRAAKFVQQQVEQRLDAVVSQRNALIMRHGMGWEMGREDESVHKGSFQRLAGEATLEQAAVAAADLNAFRDQLVSLVEQLSSQMIKRVYEVVAEGAAEVGNVVPSTEGTLADSFLAMIKKIEFGVDESGKVTRPAIHASPAHVDALMKAINEQGPQFEAEVAELTKQKEAEAIAKENTRLARFKGVTK